MNCFCQQHKPHYTRRCWDQRQNAKQPAAIGFRQQKGVALIVVLLIVALVTILATQMSNRLQLNIARTMNLKDNNQAYWYALGAEQFAKKSLRTLIQTTPNNINLGQPWAEPFEFPLENGFIRAKLEDLQACFNLNAVGSVSQPDNQTISNNTNTNSASGNQNNNSNAGNANDSQGATQNNQQPQPQRQAPGTVAGKPPSVIAFEDLLNQHVDDSLVVDTLRDSIIDWLDDDNFSEPYGAEDIDYESLPQPYLAANSQMSNISELRLVNGIGDVIRLGQLEPLLDKLCVIPEDQFSINVNTLSLESAGVLAALTGLSVDDASQVISDRPEQGYSDINDFQNDRNISALALQPNRLNWFDVTTKYFKLTTSVETNSGSQFTLVTRFHLDGDEVKIIGREFGGI